MNFNIAVPVNEIMNICSSIMKGNITEQNAEPVTEWLAKNVEYVVKVSSLLGVIDSAETKKLLTDIESTKNLLESAITFVEDIKSKAAPVIEAVN